MYIKSVKSGQVYKLGEDQAKAKLKLDPECWKKASESEYKAWIAFVLENKQPVTVKGRVLKDIEAEKALHLNTKAKAEKALSELNIKCDQLDTALKAANEKNAELIKQLGVKELEIGNINKVLTSAETKVENLQKEVDSFKALEAKK